MCSKVFKNFAQACKVLICKGILGSFFLSERLIASLLLAFYLRLSQVFIISPRTAVVHDDLILWFKKLDSADIIVQSLESSYDSRLLGHNNCY